MTLEEMRNYNRPWLTCEQIHEVLGRDPHSIRLQAHEEPEKLGFPVSVVGRRVTIPRLPFIQFMTQLEVTR